MTEEKAGVKKTSTSKGMKTSLTKTEAAETFFCRIFLSLHNCKVFSDKNIYTGSTKQSIVIEL